MKLYSILSFIFIFLLFSSCKSSYQILSDKEMGVDFSKYSSFDIIDHDHGFPLGANPINKQRIERAIIAELKEMGYNQVKDSDLIVAWFVKVDNKQEVSVYQNYYRRWTLSERIDIYEYQQGELVVDLIDSKSKQVVWHSKASDRLDNNLEDVSEKINNVVRDIFKQYRRDTKVGQ